MHKKIRKNLGAAIGCGALLLGAGLAQAATIEVFYEHANDCAGEFGRGFENCAVGGSPIIAKIGARGEGTEINSLFPSITGDEWSFDGADWSYDQGAGDPTIRFWVSKNRNDFTLFYNVDDIHEELCAGSVSMECLGYAQPTTSGSILTQGLSHVSFFDTGTQIPLPGTLGLLGMGMAGLSLLRRKGAQSAAA